MFPYGNNKLLHTVKPPISDHFVVLEENLLHAIFKFEMCLQVLIKESSLYTLSGVVHSANKEIRPCIKQSLLRG